MCLGQGERVGLFVSGLLRGIWSGPHSVIKQGQDGRLGLLGVSWAHGERDGCTVVQGVHLDSGRPRLGSSRGVSHVIPCDRDRRE